MSDKLFIGQSAGAISVPPKFDVITKVIIDLDGTNIIEAGTDGGRVFEVSCPYGTQQMANNLLAAMSGYQYQPVTAEEVLTDPALELGDAMTIGGVYSIIAQRNIDFDALMAMELAAPGQEEIESEYPYVSQQQSETDRKIAQTYSEINKTSEEIGLRVQGIENQYAELKVTVDGVTVTGLDGSTMINGGKVTTDELEVNAANIKGQLTANQINTNGLTVNAANITGSLTVGQLPDSVAEKSDIPTRTSDLTNDSGYQTRSGVVNIIDGTVTADFVEALEVAASTLKGRYIYILTSGNSTAGEFTVTGADSASFAIDLSSNGALRLQAGRGTLHIEGGGGAIFDLNTEILAGATLKPANDGVQYLGTSPFRWREVYATEPEINTSDRNYKEDINYDLSKYDTLFDALKPVSFKFVDGTSGRTHTGFIAQDIEDAINSSGLTSLDLAAFIKSPKEDKDGKPIEGEYDYGLRYPELIALCVKRIQDNDKKIAALEKTIAELTKEVDGIGG